MSATSFAPGPATAYVTDRVVALAGDGSVDPAVMDLCAHADWPMIATRAPELGVVAVAMHDRDRVRTAVGGTAVVVVDGPDGEQRFAAGDQPAVGAWTIGDVERARSFSITADGNADPPTAAYHVAAGAVPVCTVSRCVAGAGDTSDPFEALFGATVVRTVEQAAVRPDTMPESPPALGVLVFSSGERVVADTDLVIGRNPADVAIVDTSLVGARPVRIGRPAVSRRHAAVRLDRWSATIDDLGSANGTTVTWPGSPPVALQPGAPVELPIGAVVELGHEVTFTLERLA